MKEGTMIREALVLGLVVLGGLAITGHLYQPLDYVFPFVIAAVWLAVRLAWRPRCSAGSTPG
jgi:hypothetical protein